MTTNHRGLDWKLGWACPPLDKIPLEKSSAWLDKLAEFGYQGIEPLISVPNNISVEKWHNNLDKSDLTLIGFRTGGIVEAKGFTLSDPDPSIRKQAVTSLLDIIKYASDFGAQKILVGLIQGSLKPGVLLTNALGWITDGIAECTFAASKHGLQVSLEPINRQELGYNNTIAQVLTLVKKINMQNLGLLLDTFHMDQEEQDLASAIQQAKGWINHIHLADSQRLSPGLDEMNFDTYLKAFQNIDYKGFLSVECIEKPSSLIAAKSAADFLLPQFEAIYRPSLFAI